MSVKPAFDCAQNDGLFGGVTQPAPTPAQTRACVEYSDSKLMMRLFELQKHLGQMREMYATVKSESFRQQKLQEIDEHLDTVDAVASLVKARLDAAKKGGK